MLRAQLQKWFGNGSRSARRTERKLFQPGMELLEDRILLDTTSGIVVGRTLSAYSTADVQDNQVRITYTVYNQQADPVSGVLLTDTLQPGVTFKNASQLPDRNGQDLAWSLGTINAFDRASVTLTVSRDNPTLLQLDSGARAFATLNASMLTDDAPAAVLTDRVIPTDQLASTPDANTNDPFVKEKAAELDYDPQRVFDFLHNDIDYNSYFGSVRGARGTLWSSAGNALDVASLGVALMRASGISAQYVQGTLDSALAQQLIVSMFPPSYQTVSYLPAGTQTADPAHDPQLLTETESHYWLQFDTGNGMQDADPLMAEAQVGQTFTTVTNTFTEVPDNLREKTEVTLSAEMYSQGAAAFGLNPLQQNVVLTHTFNDVNLVGRPLSIGHFVSTDSVGALGLTSTTNTYTPYMIVGDDADPDPADDEVMSGQSYQELLTSVPLGNQVLTGLFVTITLSGPQGPPATYQHTILDRIGYASRQGLASPAISINPNAGPAVSQFDVTTIDVLASFITPGPAALLLNQLQAEVENASRLPSDLNTFDPTVVNVVRYLMIGITRTMNFGYMATSDAFSRLTASLSLSTSFFDRPRIIIGSTRNHLDAGTRTAALDLALDLRRDTIRTLVGPGQRSSAALSINLGRGLVDSAIEDHIASQITAAGGSSVQATSAASIVNAAIAEGIPLALVTRDSISQLDDFDISLTAKTRITTAVMEGKVVLVPTAGIVLDGVGTVSWYETDINTGETIAVMEDGGHQALASFGAVSAGSAFQESLAQIAAGSQAGAFAGNALLHYVILFVLPVIKQGSFDDQASAIANFQEFLLELTETADELFGPEGVPARIAFDAQFDTDLELANRLISETLRRRRTRKDPPAGFLLLNQQAAVNVPANRFQGPVLIPAVVSAGNVIAQVQANSLEVVGNLQPDWNSSATNGFAGRALNAVNATITDGAGNLLGVGAAAWTGAAVVPMTVAGSNQYHVDGTGSLAFYGSAENSLGVSGWWDNYSATVTGNVSITLTTDGLTLNGQTLPPGTYTITTSSATLSGSGPSTSPTFSGSVSINATNTTINLGPTSGNVTIGGNALDLTNGSALTSYTGRISVTGSVNNTDSVSLDGTAGNVLNVSGSQTALSTDQNHSVTFRADVKTSLADTYTVTAQAPPGWTVAIDNIGQVTVTPAPGLQGGIFPIRLTAQSQGHPDLVAQGEVMVTVTPTQPGITFTVDPDTFFTVPTAGGAQSPTAFRASIRNLGPAADTFTVSVTTLPPGFDLLHSGISVEVPAGETGILGVYLRPNGTNLPAPGTPLSFTLTATSTSDPAITDTKTVNFTMPDVHGLTFTATPDGFGTIPGSALTTTLTLTAVGNVSETVNLSAALSARLTATGLPPTVTLTPGETLTIPVTLTPVATTPLNSSLVATLTAKFNPLGDAFDQTITIPVRVVAPGADAIASAMVAANQLSNVDLANRLSDLSNAVTSLFQTPTSDVFRSQSLSAIDSIISLLSLDVILVGFGGPLTAARTSLAAANTPADIHAAILNLGSTLGDFATVVTNLARHNFEVDLFPDSGIAQPLIPVDYAVRIQNTGSQTTTYNVAVTGLPASVTSQFDQTSLTIAPGQIAETILTLTQTSNTELLTFDFHVDVTAANVTPELRKATLGTMQARREHVSVTDVIATPPFGDPGTNVAVSAKILNAVNRRQDVLVSYTVKDASGQTVFTSNEVSTTLTVQTSVLTVDLGSLNTTGFAKGQFTIEVHLTDPSGRPIPGGNGQTTLLVGSPVSASLTVGPQALPPGTSSVTNTLTITALVAPAEQLKLVGQLTERVFNGNTFPLNGFDVVVNGNIVYFADNFVLMSVDVSDPTNPVHVGPLLGFVQHLDLSGGRLVTTSARSGAFALRFYDVANPANPVERGAAAFGYLNVSDLEVIGNEAFVSTNLEILQSGNITEQFGDVLSLDLTSPFSSSSLDDVLFNTFGDTSSGDESFNIPRNGGPFNHFGMAAANATTLYATSTTSTGTNVNLDQNGNPAKGIVRIIDVSNPANLTQVGQVEIPGTIMVQQLVIDGNRAYVLGSQGGWKDPFTNANDIGPVGNVVMAVLDISDPRNPTVLGTPTVLNRYARGLGGLTVVGGNQFVFSSIGTLTDTAQLYLIDASDPTHLTVEKQIDAPGIVRGMSSDEEHLYVASDEGLFIYELGHPDIPVMASVQVPKGTGVAVVPGSFSVAPTTIIEGTDADTLVWDFTLVQSAPTQTLTWNTIVSGLQPGESRAVTLDTRIEFVAEGTAGVVTLPSEKVFAEQVLALSPAAQTVRPGQSAAYTLTLTNPAGVDVTYDLSVVGVPQEWVNLPTQVLVPAGGAVNVSLTLTADPFAPTGEHGFGVLASRDGTSGSVTGTLRLQGESVSSADPEAHGVVLEFTPAQATAGQGTTATFVLRLTNTGSVAETFDLTFPSLLGITALFDRNFVTVPPGASNFREVRLTLTTVEGLTPNAYAFTVATTSRNSSATDTANGSLTVVNNGVDVTLDRATGSPGDVFQLTVKNTGTVTDTFKLELGGPAALVSTLGMSQVTLAPGASQVIPLTTGTVNFAVPGTLSLAAAARSQGNPAVADMADAQLNIGPSGGMTAQFDPSSRTLTAPGTTSYLLQVDNLGNTEDSYEAVVVGTTGGLVASLAGLDGQPTQTIPIFRLPGLATGAILLNTRLNASGQGTATVQVRSLTNGTLIATVQATLTVAPPVQLPPPPPPPPAAVVGEGITTLPGSPGQPLRVEVRHVSASARFRNEAGVILLDADGRIDGLKPGDPGFLLKALTRRFVLLRRSDRPGRRRKLVLPGGRPVLFYLVQNNTLVNLLRSNPENRMGGKPLVLLGLAEANPDGKAHVRLQRGGGSSIRIGWEDQVGRSDLDFNDFVLSLRTF